MNFVYQTPDPGSSLLAFAGDVIEFTLRADGSGRAFLRTNIGRAAVRRREVIAHTEEAKPYLAADWTDIPMEPSGDGCFRLDLPLVETGFFQAKAFFWESGADVPRWPLGGNTRIKVAPSYSVQGNSIYTAFVRQFREEEVVREEIVRSTEIDSLARGGYAVIPPSGTFRNLIGRLDHIIGRLGFRILQLLPIHPTPTTYARMGRFGSPFASLDFFDVDHALAEFDGRTTPLEQFVELVDAVHARGARLFMDLPANHTGWASSFQTRRPEWFKRREDGSFKSPGAWGVTWEDLVELDFSNPTLPRALAEVFLFWCAKGVDGFRCDAGYMIPAEIWEYITARVRDVFPETIFMLEGLGGKLETTDRLLSESNLDWAYSELFQNEDREAIYSYLPSALERSCRYGPLVNFAETHDNNRLAARGSRYASMRTALAAMLSQQGAFGITAGVEWFCRDKIDVHGAPPLGWGNSENQIDFIARLTTLLDSCEAFGKGASTVLLESRDEDVVVARRRGGSCEILVAVNLDVANSHSASWSTGDFYGGVLYDVITGREYKTQEDKGFFCAKLEAGTVVGLVRDKFLAKRQDRLSCGGSLAEPSAVVAQRLNRLALWVMDKLAPSTPLPERFPDVAAAGRAFAEDPSGFTALFGGVPRLVEWLWPRDTRRVVMVPPGNFLCVRSPNSFRVAFFDGETPLGAELAVRLADGSFASLFYPPHAAVRRRVTLRLSRYESGRAWLSESEILLLPAGDAAEFSLGIEGERIRSGGDLAILSNLRSSMSQVRSAWSSVRSQYDALLAINPSLATPSDRYVFFTRCRAWIQNRGYSYELDSSSSELFYVEEGGRACLWRFRTPVGMGRETLVTFRLVLAEKTNRVDLQIARHCALGSDELEDTSPVTIILRPDVEARGFHSKTLAYCGAEMSYREAVHGFNDGFDFLHAPMPCCRMRLKGGEFHCDGRWTYGVSHDEEAARGLGASGDLYSPGWFEVELKGGEAATLEAGVKGEMALEGAPQEKDAFRCVDNLNVNLCDWLKRNPIAPFVVNRDSLKTVIAGFPWFLDWGRDTLITLRGLLAAGEVEDSVAILREFGSFEENGTLPNIILGESAANRDTSDAPLWFIVSCGDVMALRGVQQTASLKCGSRTVGEVIRAIVENYIKGTPNGICVDAASGLVFSPPHFTWMDTNYPAATPRCGYPVEIQALWIASLALLREKLGILDFCETEARARMSLSRLYLLPCGGLADSLRADPGVSAMDAVKEDAIRPNQLLAVTLGAIPADSALARAVISATSALIIPGGIRSLADAPVTVAQPVFGRQGLLNDPLRPYWGHYGGDEDTRRKPAYHNGTAWGWQFPLYCEALGIVYGRGVKKDALALLASAAEPMGEGCLGGMAEIFDGDAPHTQRGCLSQAWSVSEVLRVWKFLERL